MMKKKNLHKYHNIKNKSDHKTINNDAISNIYFNKILDTKNFRNTMQNGKKIRTPYGIIFCHAIPKNKEESYNKLHHEDVLATTMAFGIIASKKVGKAVQRNRCKRILRSIIQQYIKKYNNTNDIKHDTIHNIINIVIVANKFLLDAKYDVMKQVFHYNFRKSFQFIIKNTQNNI